MRIGLAVKEEDERRKAKDKRRNSIARAKKQRRISEVKARSKRRESEGIPGKTPLKRSEKALYPTARAGTEKDGESSEKNGAGTEKLRRYLGGFPEESRSSPRGISEKHQRKYGETPENR